MGDTWITDMTHYDYSEEEEHAIPNPAKRLAGYLASIIQGTVKRTASDGDYAGVRCRRRPGRKPCLGSIRSELHPNGNELRWWCPVCGDNGVIYNWVGTRWEPKKETYYPDFYSRLAETGRDTRDTVVEVLTGHIEFDADRSEVGSPAPKIVTPNGEATWKELGERLLEYEGWRVRIQAF